MKFLNTGVFRKNEKKENFKSLNMLFTHYSRPIKYQFA